MSLNFIFKVKRFHLHLPQFLSFVGAVPDHVIYSSDEPTVLLPPPPASARATVGQRAPTATAADRIYVTAGSDRSSADSRAGSRDHRSLVLLPLPLLPPLLPLLLPLPLLLLLSLPIGLLATRTIGLI